MKKRPGKAAAARRRRRRRIIRRINAILAFILALALTAWGALLLMDRMSRAPQEQDMAMPTQLPSVTIAPYAAIEATPSPTLIPVNTAAPHEDDAWQLVLVNQWHTLPEGYEPPAMTVLSNGQSVDKRMYPALQDMFDDARDDKVYPEVKSGYRTREEQQQRLDDRIAFNIYDGHSEKWAVRLAQQAVPAPGASEHETGLAIDVGPYGNRSTEEEVLTWMAENCHKYGFILRYTEDKEGITGVTHDAAHLRYVGKAAAALIKEQGVCLEEYLGIVDAN